ncbi:MAG: hypothetical protein WCS94_05305 [Verrucomicrobiota bacterium]
MSRTAPQISCHPEKRQILERWAASRTEPKQTVDRARIIIGCLVGRVPKELPNDHERKRAQSILEAQGIFPINGKRRERGRSLAWF